MKKKFLGILLVVILVGFLFVVGCGVVLFLAPGTEVFGIRYIAKGRSNCEVVEPLATHTAQNIYLKTHSVPITINYTDYYSAEVKFCQNFVGFTKSKHDVAGVDVTTDENGDIHINVKEMVKWLYAVEFSDDYSLVLTLPKVYANNKSLYIDSVDSDCEIKNGAVYDNFSMSSEGGLKITDGSVYAHNLKYHTEKMINIDSNLSGYNYDLKSTGSSINIKKATEGDIKAVTKSGDVRFVSCKNLKVRTGSGSIRTYGGGFNSVLNSVDIETKGGDISLGSVATLNVDSSCKIYTLSGDVNIKNMKDGNITSERGEIDIGYSRALILTTKIGDINVDEATEGITVNGRNGDVTLGELGTITNVKVTTTTGKIVVKNTYGKVDLISESNSIKLKNSGSSDISVVAGKGVTATDLKGTVYVKANGDIDLGFFGITGNVTIETGGKADKVKIDAGTTSYLDVDYKITSTKGKKAKVYCGEDLIAENSKLDTGYHDGKYKISVKTSYAYVTLKLAI